MARRSQRKAAQRGADATGPAAHAPSAPEIRLVATTLSGNSEELVADALRSVVDWVDVCLLIDTGITDTTRERAREVAGDKLVVRTLAWTNDFAAARNFALDAAAECGGDWAVTLDTDERLDVGAIDVRAVLARATEGVFYVSDAARTYVKERFFRLPTKARWSGPTHESFPAYQAGARTLEGVTFTELAKSKEAYQRKFERDAEVLARYTAEHPTDPRWWFYLGESHRHLGHHQAAAEAYDRCAALRGWDEESAWACYRAADCMLQLGRPAEAIDRCAAGLARHAGIAELAWLAGYACYQLNRDAQAIHWSKLAVVHGLFRGDGAAIQRIGFRHPSALWEGPYDVMRWAFKRLGNVAAMNEAELLYQAAKKAREATA